MTAAYLHIPFCTSICSYCDFTKQYYCENLATQYLIALEREIREKYNGEPLETIYIGGGTPTSLSFAQWEKLCSILELFKKKDHCEITVEGNIEGITAEKLRLLKEHGVNRLSLGVQSFHPKQLEFLNRHHRKEQIETTVAMCKKFGFTNINLDLIYALPGETLEDLEEDLRSFLACDIPHISTYSLMIEPHTVLGIRQITPIAEEIDAKMYERIIEILTQHGYEHYETSNFSRPGYQSRHNLTYWNNEPYYGFGAGASGYISDVRYTNTSGVQNYIRIPHREEQRLDYNMTMENEFILGFRKTEGISKTTFKEKYHRDLKTIVPIRRLLQHGQLEEAGDFIRLPKSYQYIANTVLVSFIGENYEETSRADEGGYNE